MPAMLSTLIIVIPVFALIFAGWLARRLAVLGSNATTELNRFVVYLALPALLFDIVAHARLSEIWQPGFIAVFALGCLAVFALTVLVSLKRPLHLADAVIDGLNAGYANVGFIGFPLVAVAIGRNALGPTLVATMITVCVLFGAAIVLIEIGLQTEQRPARMVLKVVRSLGRNPLLVAPVAGAVVPIAGLAIPSAAETFLKLLGGAASPCALVALGLFLAEQRDTKPDAAPACLLVGFKLVLQPALTWVLASFVFELPAALSHTAVLLAALPTGTGPFMLAEYYRREAGMTSKVILASTVLSLLSVSGYLYVTH
ncbi:MULTISPECIES: AEC family transporter [unclassified Acidiphilium]|uniref:AEC family transporter n=1 Tax=unclassified Acidiphilium TaxID=2617493 RepID=UPI0002145531|nr:MULTISPECIES: AEC family transporter [unclassified Acidiphilium]EGO94206.1 Auxin efflux carrier [Acidiphilium sp. PM]KDM67741.1 putative malonate transporter MdcF [Acidiphilium sp. JA12-A1]